MRVWESRVWLAAACCAHLLRPEKWRTLLQLEAADVQGQAEVEHAALHLGQAQGISALLRGTHYHAAR